MTKPQYFDSHAHLTFSQYDKDQDAVIARTLSQQIFWLEVGTDLEQSSKTVQLAEKIGAGVWASVGLHPTEWSKWPDQTLALHRLETLARSPRVVAIGECGLDYYRPTDRTAEAKRRQQDLFFAQIDLAQKLAKPIVIHARPTPNTFDAYQDILNIWRARNCPPSQLHCYAGNRELAGEFLARGAMFSFTALITFNRSWDELIKNLPLERLLAETDSPFLAPAPNRGQRNEPLNVRAVVKSLAERRDATVEDLAPTLVENAWRFFGLVVR